MAREQKFQLTGHDQFDSLISSYAETDDAEQQESILAEIWERFGTTGATSKVLDGVARLLFGGQ